MPSPSHEERICAMFDSFAKSVARNYAVDLQRAEKSRSKHFADEPVVSAAVIKCKKTAVKKCNFMVAERRGKR